jgi:isoleucyl-tRNA synthetase
MKEAAALIQQWGNAEISELEKQGQAAIQLKSGQALIALSEVEITANDIPGWE